MVVPGVVGVVGVEGGSCLGTAVLGVVGPGSGVRTPLPGVSPGCVPGEAAPGNVPTPVPEVAPGCVPG